LPDAERAKDGGDLFDRPIELAKVHDAPASNSETVRKFGNVAVRNAVDAARKSGDDLVKSIASDNSGTANLPVPILPHSRAALSRFQLTFFFRTRQSLFQSGVHGPRLMNRHEALIVWDQMTKLDF
jgi:hypothetical protein